MTEHRRWRPVRRMLTAEVSTAEAAGLAHAVAGTARSFERGLLPRATVHQAGLTGVWGAINYGLATTTQSFIEAGANRFGARRISSPAGRRAALMAADLVAIGVGQAMQYALAPHPAESLWRASGRSLGWRLRMTGVAGAVALGVDGLSDAVRRDHTTNSVNAPLVAVAGAGVMASMYWTSRRRLQGMGVELDEFGQSVADYQHGGISAGAETIQRGRAIAVGIGVSAALFGLSRVERAIASGLSDVVAAAAPGAAPFARPIGHAAALSGLALAIERAVAYAYRATEQDGKAIEPAYDRLPSSPVVSAGPNSAVSWDSLGREGRRFVNMALPAAEISAVTQRPAVDPVRVFVGVDSAESPNARAFLAMEELDRLGGMSRGIIAVYAPTGSGYVNYVAAEALEYLTDGDVASVCIQYSVRPSFLSLEQVGTAWESYLAFLTALSWRLRSMPADERPRVVLFGESLGSQAAQDVFAKEGTHGFDLLGIDRALFIGSPFASKWRRQWLADPAGTDPDGIVVEVDGIDGWRSLDEATRSRARVVLLTHHQDPIPKFGPRLLVQEPLWMGDPTTRPPGIPRETSFAPIATFLITGVDLLNSMHVVPGAFEAFGHDYRLDLAEMVRAAYRLEADDALMERVERALRERELEWAERRVIAETLEDAERKVRSTIEAWGLDSSAVPGLVVSDRQVTPDPYEAVKPDA